MREDAILGGTKFAALHASQVRGNVPLRSAWCGIRCRSRRFTGCKVMRLVLPAHAHRRGADVKGDRRGLLQKRRGKCARICLWRERPLGRRGATLITSARKRGASARSPFRSIRRSSDETHLPGPSPSISGANTFGRRVSAIARAGGRVIHAYRYRCRPEAEIDQHSRFTGAKYFQRSALQECAR